ncbi:MAG: hypothetical protein JWP88_1208, partial [Flaviaesturariibacter sp.]|nr:hypothetical protein [Flaviaesturariibacter sp.]
MKRKYFIYTLTTLAALAIAGPSCKKFLDVNKNLNSPTPESVAIPYV